MDETRPYQAKLKAVFVCDINTGSDHIIWTQMTDYQGFVTDLILGSRKASKF